MSANLFAKNRYRMKLRVPKRSIKMALINAFAIVVLFLTYLLLPVIIPGAILWALLSPSARKMGRKAAYEGL